MEQSIRSKEILKEIDGHHVLGLNIIDTLQIYSSILVLFRFQIILINLNFES